MSSVSPIPTVTTSIDTYVGLIIGSVLTLFVSVLMLVITNHFAQKQRMKERVLDSEQKIKEQTFSPLFFYIFDLNAPIGGLSGTFGYCIKSKLEYFNEQAFANIIDKHYSAIKYEYLRRLFENNFCHIRPSQLRGDFFTFYLMLEAIFNSHDTFKDNYTDKDKLLQILKNHYRVIEIIGKFNIEALELFNDKFFEPSTSIEDLKYTKFFTDHSYTIVLEALGRIQTSEQLKESEKKLIELEKELGVKDTLGIS